MRRFGVALVVGLIVLGGCSAAASTPSPSPSPSPMASPSPSGGQRTLINGTVTCDVTSFDEQNVGGKDVLVEHFSCQNVTSDPRLDGSMEADFTTTFEPDGASAGRWEGPQTITNAGGTWHGQGHGAVVVAADGTPTNYGVTIYEGAGGYAGLVYHEFVAGGDASADVTGWIEPTR